MFNATFNNISVISWRHGELKIYIETVLKIYDEVLKQSWCLVNNYDELVVIFYSQFKTSVLINCHTNTNSTECTVWEYIFCDLRVYRTTAGLLKVWLKFQNLSSSYPVTVITCTRGVPRCPLFPKTTKKVVSYPSAIIFRFIIRLANLIS